MAARFQEWVKRNLWDNSSYPDGLATINGTVLSSILDYGITDEPVTIRRALRVSTVYICVFVPSRTICSLPINVIKESEGSKTVDTEHPVYYALCHEPNDHMSSANFMLTMMIHLFAWGNAYAKIYRDSRQNPISFDIWPPEEVAIKWSGDTYWYTRNGETIPARDILHFRQYSFDGICGRSPIIENAATIGQAIKLDRYEGLITGARPPGILSYEGHLSPEQIKQNELRWKNPGTNTKVLDGKWTYQSIMTNPEASQWADAKTINQRELYGIWQLPPTFAQNFERATFSNAEQSDLVYAKHTITPTVRIIEQECNLKLFRQSEKKNTYVKMNMNALLRGDIAARQAFYQSMVNTGVMSRNEARSYEDLNPYPGGDDFLVQGAMVPADLLRKNMEAMIEATNNPAPAPATDTEKAYGRALNGHKNGAHVN